jgi:two-component system, response regulator, stage 0 sporulation protein F
MNTAHRHVLVVDDDQDIRDTLVLLLREEGYETFEAPDGQPALERLRQSQERMVVLLDMQMPGVDGLAVLEAVAAQAQLATRHAYILVTAYGGRTMPLKMANLLVELNVPILPKPFDINTVLEAVHQAELRLEPNT